MRYIHFNPNPKKENASDCVVRMLCCVTGKPWAQAFLDLAEKSLELGDMPSKNTVWIALLTDMGFKRYSLPDTCPNCYTVEDFCVDNPKGEFVLATGTHVLTVKDGFFYDSWDSSQQVPIFFLRR